METASIAQPTDGAQELRRQLHGMWDSVAAGWSEHAGFIDTRGAAVTQRLLELTAPRPGDRVLELACGPGGAGLAAARLVAPEGEVVLSDVSPAMTVIAAQRAAAQGLDNVRSRTIDLEQIDEPDGSYDVVLCREGLMLVPDPRRGAREMARVLAPGGRVGLAVWGAQERNPWLGVVFDAVGAELGTPVPPPGIPGPFSLDDPNALAEILAEAGFVDVDVRELPTPYYAASVEEWWTRTAALAGPLAKRLASLPDDAKGALFARARLAVSRYETGGTLELPGLSLIAGATRA